MKALLVVALLLLGLLVVGDRVAVGFAEDKVATEIAAKGGLQGTPEVDITGFPFLTQAIGGRYDDVRISLTAAELGQPEGTRADIALHGVRVPLSAVAVGLGQRGAGGPDRRDGDPVLRAAVGTAGGGHHASTREGDGLRITRTVELLGQTVPLTAAGTVTLDGNDLVVDVRAGRRRGGGGARLAALAARPACWTCATPSRRCPSA